MIKLYTAMLADLYGEYVKNTKKSQLNFIDTYMPDQQ